MSESAQWIERLAHLSRRDRNWILVNLSAGAKANLLSQLNRGSPLVQGSSAQGSPLTQGSSLAQGSPLGQAPGNARLDPIGRELTPDEERAVDILDGGSVAAHLVTEQPWVIALILRIRSWRWEQQVLSALAPVSRLEVTQLRSSLPPLSTSMAALLVRTLRQQLEEQQPSSRFEQLFDRAQSRGATEAHWHG